MRSRRYRRGQTACAGCGSARGAEDRGRARLAIPRRELRCRSHRAHPAASGESGPGDHRASAGHRAGGRVVAADPDWATLTVDAPDEEASAVVVRAHVTHVTNGTMGRQLRRRFIDAGFEDVAFEPMAFAVTDLTVRSEERRVGKESTE